MSYKTPDANISVTGRKAWQGTDKSNGILMLGDSVPHIETSFSSLVLGSGLTGLSIPYVPFGNVVWYSSADIANGIYGKVYGAMQDSVLHVAGIMKYVQGQDIGFTMNRVSGYQNGVMPHMKGTIIKRGFVWYKQMYDSGDLDAFIDFADITMEMCLFANVATGLPVLAQPTEYSTYGRPLHSSGTFIGTIELLEPENESVLINVGWDYPVTYPAVAT